MDASIQLALSISVPTLAVLVGILINNSRLGDVNDRLSDLRAEMNSRFDTMDRRMDQRFEDVKAMWRSELHRVEEVLDARLKHLEER
jgi:hypothetical protein